MKYFIILFALFSVRIASAQQKDKTYNLLVGTYTQPGKSDGIYVYTFNSSTGELTTKSKITDIKNPSFLAISHDRKHVYSVNEMSEGTVSAFSFNSQTGALSLMNTAPSG